MALCMFCRAVPALVFLWGIMSSYSSTAQAAKYYSHPQLDVLNYNS